MSKKDAHFLCASFWWIWKSRNAEVLSGDPKRSFVVIRYIQLDVSTWMVDKNVTDCIVSVARLVKWVWPSQGFIKLNVDGSFRGNSGSARFGGLARGDDGRWIFGFYGSIGLAGNLLPELIATFQGLCLAWNHGFRRVLCESNSLEAIRLIHSPSPDLHHFQAVIMEIKSWLSREWHVLVSHVLREGNQYADHLAKLGAS